MALNLDAVGKTLGPALCEYNEDDVILYALGVGAQPGELDFLYEKNLKVLPTFAVVAAKSRDLDSGKLLNLDYTKVLHGENRIEIYQPLSPRAKISATVTVKAIYDKGKGAVVVSEIEARDESGDLVFKNIPTTFIRGEGGFGGDRGPTGAKNVPPDRAPDKVVSMKTQDNQAQIYRLSGDKNPLHVDPEFAKRSGFDRPILHGLCTYGHCGRAVLQAYCDNDPGRLKAFEVRFSGVVYPGETITTEMWKVDEKTIVFQAKTSESSVVISNAVAELA